MVKQSLFMAGHVPRISGCWDSQISSQSANEGSKVNCPTHRPSLTPQAESTAGPQCRWKESMENSDNTIGNRKRKPQLVAQCPTLKTEAGSLSATTYIPICTVSYPRTLKTLRLLSTN